MSNYKAIITDLDGTAVPVSSDGSDVSEANIAAIRRAQDNGYKAACATGRSWRLAKVVVGILGFASPCIIEGGSRIIDVQTEETLWERRLDAPALSAILDIFKRESDTGEVYTARFSHTELHTVTEVPNDSRFIYLLGVHKEPASAICEAVNNREIAVAHTTPSWSGEGKLDVHVTHPEATKKQAVQVWQELLNVSKEQTIGMGDSQNDMPFFRSVNMKVAVDNATPELKQAADYIAPSCDEDALAQVIKRFQMSD